MVAEPLKRPGANQLPIPPYKYDDTLYLREIVENIGIAKVAKIRLRALIDPDDCGVPPLYGPFRVPGLQNHAILGAFAIPFVAANVNPSSPDPSAGDSRVIRSMFFVREPDVLEMALFDNNTGSWPGDVSGTLVDPKMDLPASIYGGVGDFQANAGRAGAPVTSTLSKGTRVAALRLDEEGDPSDPSGVNTYTLFLNSGSAILVEVSVLDPQPEVGLSWPLDQEGNRYPYTVLDVHENQQRVYPRRNAYVIPTLSDDPAHATPVTEHKQLTVVAVQTKQNFPLDPSETVQEVTLSDGQNIVVPITQTVTAGMVWPADPSNPSQEFDPSGFEQAALDPTKYWEFDVFLVLVQRTQTDTTLGGYAADVWPVPAFLEGCPSSGEPSAPSSGEPSAPSAGA